jgi:AcrR family transcriptional regulator
MPESAKSRILDAAERLFARNGFEGTSLRAIIAEAQVNLASIHYYYRSREGLIRAVIERCFAPINRERLRLLEECEKKSGDCPPAVEGILQAFLAPMISIGMKKSRHSSNLMQLSGRVLLESGGEFEKAVEEQFREVAQCFLAAFQRALPQLTIEEIASRMNFTIGAAAKAMFAGVSMKVLAQALGKRDPEIKTANYTSVLVTYVAAGMKAPPAVRIKPSRKMNH